METLRGRSQAIIPCKEIQETAELGRLFAQCIMSEKENRERPPVPNTLPVPRKRRTREHIIADLSVNYLERFILEAGHTAERQRADYGYDLVMVPFDVNGFLEPGRILFQLKAAQELQKTTSQDHVVVQLDTRDINVWRHETFPVFLVVYDASKRAAYWLYVQAYFQTDKGRLPRAGAKSARILIPTRQRVTKRFMAYVRSRLMAVVAQTAGEVHHVG